MLIRKKPNKLGSFSVQIISKIKGINKVVKTIDYLFRYQGVSLNLDNIYRFMDKLNKKFNLCRPIVVADAGLLSTQNINLLEADGYKYILGARIKNETKKIKQQITGSPLINDEHKTIKKNTGQRLTITYSDKRAAKYEHNRKRRLQQILKM